MLNFYLLPFLILFTLSADRISCTPIQEKAHEPSSHSSITITPPNHPSPIHLNITHPPNAPPLRISSARACIASVLDDLHAQDPRASVPNAGMRAHIDGVWFHAYPISENYTYDLLTTTIQLLTDELQTHGGYVACDWEVSTPNNDDHHGRVLGRGSMWPDLITAPGSSNASQPSSRLSLSHPTTTTLPPQNPNNHQNIALHFHLDNPPHPLNPTDADGCLGIAFMGIAHHDLNTPISQGVGRLQAGNVVLNIESLSEKYTWGLFDYTVRRVQAEMWARGWWSCGWEVRGGDGEAGGLYARGRLWSPVGGRRVDGGVV